MKLVFFYGFEIWIEILMFMYEISLGVCEEVFEKYFKEKVV